MNVEHEKIYGVHYTWPKPNGGKAVVDSTKGWGARPVKDFKDEKAAEKPICNGNQGARHHDYDDQVCEKNTLV